MECGTVVGGIPARKPLPDQAMIDRSSFPLPIVMRTGRTLQQTEAVPERF
jgi:hypothetical protein